MTPQEAARVLKISTMGLWKAKKRGEIRSETFERGKYLYDKEEVIRWKNQRKSIAKSREAKRRSKNRFTKSFRGITEKHRALVEKLKCSNEDKLLIYRDINKHKLSVRATMRSLRADRIITDQMIWEGCPQRIGIYAIQAIRLDFDRWRRQTKSELWRDHDREKFLEEARPIYDFYVEQEKKWQFSMVKKKKRLSRGDLETGLIGN